MTSASPAGSDAAVPMDGSVGLLLSQVGRKVARSFHARLAPLDLDPRHYLVLRALGAAPGRSQHAVGSALQIPPSRMVVLVDVLAERGLVERVANPVDRRAHALHLTAAGRRMVARAAPLAAAHDAEVCGPLDEREQAVLVDLLGRLAAGECDA